MTEPRDDDRTQARREAAVLLGVDIERLSPADSLRVDMISALRLVIDSEQASILSGGAADLGKLNVAVQSLIALLPSSKLPEVAPVEGSKGDWRTIVWENYLAARRRGETADPMSTFEGRGREVERLRARVAELESGAPAPDEPSAPPPDNVVPLPRATAGKQNSAQAPPPPPAAARGYDYNANQDWKSYVEPTGEIRSTPRGRWDV
jgi:hypothetical protein